MDDILKTYYDENAKKLRAVVDKILRQFGGLSDKDRDDFYSLANEVFVDAMRRHDGYKPFDVFLYACLSNRIKTEMTKRNREKRKIDRLSVSIDMPVNDKDGSTLGDVLPGDFNLEIEILKDGEEGYSKKMLLYLDRLSKIQREALELMTDGYLPDEITEKLQISKKQYLDCCAAIHAYRNISVLL